MEGESFDRRSYRAPPGAARLAMWAFLLSLGVFFTACFLGYIVVRHSGPVVPRAGAIQFPYALWISTAILVASSVTMDYALRSVRRERQPRFRWAMAATTALAVAFFAVQGPALVVLLQRLAIEETRQTAKPGPDADLSDIDPAIFRIRNKEVQVYAFVFMLVVVHALHAVGGVVPMAVVCVRAWRGRYDHEVYSGVKYCAMYWHFLDAVWLAMFSMFLIVR